MTSTGITSMSANRKPFFGSRARMRKQIADHGDRIGAGLKYPRR
jgi:hypothetical protein